MNSVIWLKCVSRQRLNHREVRLWVDAVMTHVVGPCWAIPTCKKEGELQFLCDYDVNASLAGFSSSCNYFPRWLKIDKPGQTHDCGGGNSPLLSIGRDVYPPVSPNSTPVCEQHYATNAVGWADLVLNPENTFNWDSDFSGSTWRSIRISMIFVFWFKNPVWVNPDSSQTLTQVQVQLKFVRFGVERSRELDPHLECLSSANDQFLAKVTLRVMLSPVLSILGFQEVDGSNRQQSVWERGEIVRDHEEIHDTFTQQV